MPDSTSIETSAPERAPAGRTAAASGQAQSGWAQPGWARMVPGVFVLFWATGFLIAKFGLPYALPFTFLLIRFVLAAAIMLAIALAARAPWPAPRQAFHIAVTGLLLQAVYLGGCYTALAAGVSAGMMALIAGLQPILTAAVAGPLLGERLRPLQWLGIALGFIGLVMVIWEKLGLDAGHLRGLAMAFVSLLGITSATLYQKRFCPTMDLRSGAFIQYAVAAIVLAPIVGIVGVGAIDWTPPFIFAVVWMVIVLSVVSAALLTWMIQRGAASKVASLFYLTPPLAALGGYLLFDERLPPLALAGMAVIALAVVLVNRRFGAKPA